MRHRFVCFALTIGAAALAGCAVPTTDVPPGEGSETYIADRAPPPISGGTLLVTRSGLAVAADSDRDRIWVVDLASQSLVTDVGLERGDEPGRVVEDDAGRVHVLLRQGGAIATLDPARGKLLSRRPTCASPRGIAFDSSQQLLHVACESGELVSLPVAGGPATRVLDLGRDLRDVVVADGMLFVTRFRSAELLVLSPTGDLVQTQTLPDFVDQTGTRFSASVAWRMTAVPGAGIAISHQRGAMVSVPVQEGGYTSVGCAGIVHSALSFFASINGSTGQLDGTGAAAAIPAAALPVDVAVSANGAVALAAAGSKTVLTGSLANLRASEDQGSCTPPLQSVPLKGEPVAVAFAPSALVAQVREPASLVLLSNGQVTGSIALAGESVRDTGHALFHQPPSQGGGFACASCHPEGRDDGRVWSFDGSGKRRTQNISGGILETAPFHWDGALGTMNALVNEVFTTRMAGQPVGPHEARAFKSWVGSVPRLPVVRPTDVEAVARGEAIFKDANVGCTHCHSGAKLTNNQSAVVGTGAPFQVPSLRGVADRAPYMHDGCAPSLAERFLDPSCGGGDLHGHTSHLSTTQIQDLVAYLLTL
jgi:hypothetical protein